MSIWATWFYLDGGMECEEGAPWPYNGSHVLPERNHPRGAASLDVAALSRFVRYNRDNPDGTDEPEGVEPWLRLSVNTADVILDEAQVFALHDILGAWLVQLRSQEVTPA